MRKFNKNGLLKSMTAMLILVLAFALTLTGCSDNDARDAAKSALAAAEAAQGAADQANNAATNAQNSANDAQNDADANRKLIDALPDDEAVAVAVKQILDDYVNGALLEENSIVTMESLAEFLQGTQVANLLSNYATVSSLANYATDSDLEGLAQALQAEKNNIIKEMQSYVSAAALASARTDLEAQIKAGDGAVEIKLNDAVNTLTKEINKVLAQLEASMGTVDTKISKALYDYCTSAKVAQLIDDADKLGAYMKANGYAKVEDLVSALTSYADNAVAQYALEYKAATEVMVTLVLDIDARLARKAAYSDAEYAELAAILDAAKIRIMRAQTVKEATELYNNAIAAVNEQVTDLATELSAALANVDTILIPVDSVDDGYLSADQLAACRKVIEGCDATQLATVADLVAELEALEVAYQNLLNAAAAKAAVIEAINAIPAYDELTSADLEFSAAFNAATTVYTEWVKLYFGGDAADTVNKQNIQRILGDAYDYYYGAELKMLG